MKNHHKFNYKSITKKNADRKRRYAVGQKTFRF